MKKNQSHHQKPEEEKIQQLEIPKNETPIEENRAPVTPDLQIEVDKYRDLALRAAADLENYRKRMIREKEEAIRYANLGLIERLLPILDNFELGLDAARGDTSAQGIVNGFEMVHRQLSDFLLSVGLQPIDAVGQLFNSKLHEALSHETDTQQADEIVLKQVRRGYRLADRLVRPSSVIVNKIS